MFFVPLVASPTKMPEIIDDKAQHVVPFILSLLAEHQKTHSSSSHEPPFFIGLNGVQGAGKTVLVDHSQENTDISTTQSPDSGLLLG